MKRVISWVLAVVLLVVIGGLLLVTYQQADHIVHYPLETRTPAKKQQQDFDLQVKEAVTYKHPTLSKNYSV